MAKHVLVTIPASHYCERARWALDYAGIAYKEDKWPPLLHYAGTLPASGTKSVPVLKCPKGAGPRGKVLTDSADIVRYAHEHMLAASAPAPCPTTTTSLTAGEQQVSMSLEDCRPQPVNPTLTTILSSSLYPSDPEELRQVLQLEQLFSRKLGVWTRVVAYQHLFKDRDMALDVLSGHRQARGAAGLRQQASPGDGKLPKRPPPQQQEEQGCQVQHQQSRREEPGRGQQEEQQQQEEQLQQQQGMASWRCAALRWLYPVVRGAICRGMRVNEETAAACLQRVRQVFDEVGARLGAGGDGDVGGSRYLVGSHFTAADLTFAAMSAVLLMPEGLYGAYLPPLEAWGPDFPGRQLRETVAGRHALRMYEMHRWPVGRRGVQGLKEEVERKDGAGVRLTSRM
ncbi:hypothetical protein Agub_g6975 [Astrephomene gubernaculifera]|uniref:GST N-terminal domain-containing protein n=1 Tax=Astrephomene gubernaculifera TaxID=47775 RepID=A0AAD3DPC3_9CHLO|nr:hypothetical protein Agub_g6975 [Astrephomene gubernaculifera]